MLGACRRAWFRKAGDQGYVDAQCNLGFVFERGRGVKQDFIEAVRWYRKAADQGYAGAQSNPGLMLEKGKELSRTSARPCAGTKSQQTKEMPTLSSTSVYPTTRTRA
jgi:TPR repeat protein